MSEQVIAVNLTGTMRICSAARPRLAQRGGAIVNLASMLSFFGGALVPAYSASRGRDRPADSIAGAGAGLGCRMHRRQRGGSRLVSDTPDAGIAG